LQGYPQFWGDLSHGFEARSEVRSGSAASIERVAANVGFSPQAAIEWPSVDVVTTRPTAIAYAMNFKRKPPCQFLFIHIWDSGQAFSS